MSMLFADLLSFLMLIIPFSFTPVTKIFRFPNADSNIPIMLQTFSIPLKRKFIIKIKMYLKKKKERGIIKILTQLLKCFSYTFFLKKHVSQGKLNVS